MYSLTFVFHLASMITFVWAIYSIVVYRSQLSFQIQLWKSLKGENRVLVEEPCRFYRRLAKCLDINLIEKGRIRQAPCRISPKPWLELYTQFGISLLRCERDSKSDLEKIFVCLDRSPDNIAEWCEVLCKSVSFKSDIRISSNDKSI